MATKDDKEPSSRKAKEALQQHDEDLLRDIFHQYNIAYSKNDPIQINLTLAYFSALLIRISRQAEKSTRRIIDLTKALLGLTVALLIVSIVQIVIFYQNVNTTTHREQTQEYRQQQKAENKQIQPIQTQKPKVPIKN